MSTQLWKSSPAASTASHGMTSSGKASTASYGKATASYGKATGPDAQEVKARFADFMQAFRSVLPQSDPTAHPSISNATELGLRPSLGSAPSVYLLRQAELSKRMPAKATREAKKHLDKSRRRAEVEGKASCAEGRGEHNNRMQAGKRRGGRGEPKHDHVRRRRPSQGQ